MIAVQQSVTEVRGGPSNWVVEPLSVDYSGKISDGFFTLDGKEAQKVYKRIRTR